MKGFLSDVFNRRCCASCPFAEPRRSGDITLADFWGIREYCKDLFSELGTSLVFTNTDRGRTFFGTVRKELAMLRECPLSVAVNRQGKLRRPSPVSKDRARFFTAWRAGERLSVWFRSGQNNASKAETARRFGIRTAMKCLKKIVRKVVRKLLELSGLR